MPKNATRGAADMPMVLLLAAAGMIAAAVVPGPTEITNEPNGIFVGAAISVVLRVFALLYRRRIKFLDVAVGDLGLTGFAGAASVILFRLLVAWDPLKLGIPRAEILEWLFAMFAGFLSGEVFFQYVWRKIETRIDSGLPAVKGGDVDAP